MLYSGIGSKLEVKGGRIMGMVMFNFVKVSDFFFWFECLYVYVVYSFN